MSSTIRLDPTRLASAYAQVRSLTEALAAPLGPEDQCVQSMPDTSPTKWHLAHTSWFFETFVLDGPGYVRYREGWDFLFNSYYQTVGTMHARPRRGLLSRPTVPEILAYRRAVDARVVAALPSLPADKRALVELGLHHEQQHQELILTDIKHVLSCNPLAPAYRDPGREAHPAEAPALRWVEDPGGLVELGRDQGASADAFGFDNEGPRHKRWLEPFALASRLVTCAEYLAFMNDDGYARPELWLSEGWDVILREGWRAPSYWRPPEPGEAWTVFTLDGVRELDLAAPVCHLSYYEADAFARWSGARLPSEAEWEQVAGELEVAGNLLPTSPKALARASLHPEAARASADSSGLAQLFGDVWEWTASPYSPYPGYRPPPGAVGEYNGKFMCNQMVLRGGSCATPANHVRPGYRNFFAAPSRWQFSGLRLAKDL
ncbi:Iron(II)-dependent oxidoreductase EgtB [Enhygromyxa salina]|uniref:Iron(II)-dependent oxidoreductase EgtB n=1 Tax=Enhygromyxa salina TaxID=215803 RepID=A0A2S9YKZ9_9BACT|nr:ergothioneine biosynthesis protein EgtB [Enhygromyxa salina]PRQ05738.1 Iron(II)-dependent oxidoreductase EgtB [Enhygromyxa salina]